jgi:NAD(P)H-hydrate epimerase
MDSMPANIYSVAAVREIDRTTIEDHGVPGYTLMTRAGEAAVEAAGDVFPNARRWQVVCGAGNNAGDGYVVARLAAREGLAVSVLTLVDPSRLTLDAATAYNDFVADGGVVSRWEGKLDADADLLVDGILGSGLEREVAGEFALAVSAINKHPAPVLALDIPTGINGDSGAVLGCAVRARRRTRHKGDFGHVLVIGGGEGMPGAVRLAGEAALRSGAGLVSVATHPSHASMLVASRPELMSHAVGNADDLDPLLERADVIAFGPGLGQSEWARELFARVSKETQPAVWDADALNLLAENPARAEHRVITPHPGEAGRLLGVGAAQIQSDRPAALASLAQKYGGTVVLKGSGSLVSSASVPLLCSSGNPGMGSAGMGDVLSGVIAALIGQGLTPEQAAAVGVEAHARAGDRAAEAGERGLIASDLLAQLRAVINP